MTELVGTEIGRYSYSMIELCKECKKDGPDHPVDMFKESRTFLVCTPCRFGVVPEPKQLVRRKRIAGGITKRTP